jgi:uncharacterized protein HemX
VSQKEGFTGGFLVGALLGSLVGGVVGALVANRSNQKPAEETAKLPASTPISLGTEEEMEQARRNLENKIAQLNCAIDDVRQQLENVHHSQDLSSQ